MGLDEEGTEMISYREGEILGDWARREEGERKERID